MMEIVCGVVYGVVVGVWWLVCGDGVMMHSILYCRHDSQHSRLGYA